MRSGKATTLVVSHDHMVQAEGEQALQQSPSSSALVPFEFLSISFHSTLVKCVQERSPSICLRNKLVRKVREHMSARETKTISAGKEMPRGVGICQHPGAQGRGSMGKSPR